MAIAAIAVAAVLFAVAVMTGLSRVLSRPAPGPAPEAAAVPTAPAQADPAPPAPRAQRPAQPLLLSRTCIQSTRLPGRSLWETIVALKD